MSRTVPSWLNDPVAIVIGQGLGVEAVAHELAAAGATIARGPYAGSLDDAGEAIDLACSAARAPVTLLVHGEPNHDISEPEELTPEMWRQQISHGLDSRFFYAAALANRLFAAKSRGSVLFLARPWREASVGASATGGATRNLVQTLAVEWARDGIRTNAIETKFIDGGSPAELRSFGALAAYLLSDYAAYVTGSIIGVDVEVV